MTSTASLTSIYLASYLAPLEPFLQRDDVTDLYINRPGELWIETLGGALDRHELPALNPARLERLVRQIAALSHQGISREHPLLSATLPDGARVQVVGPPATRGPMAIAIRKHLARGLRLDDYVTGRAFDTVQLQGGDDVQSVDDALARLHSQRDFSTLLRLAVRERKNILVSGGTATGKTTFLGALIHEIPSAERLILIEDTPELDVPHANSVGLIAARSALGEAVVGAEDLLNASLRMRPDRIILGELRGPEAFTFLRAINTGHPGSMTTVHADSPMRAIEQIALLVLQTGTRLDRESVTHYIRSTIDVFVQLGRNAGHHCVADIALRGML